MGSIACLIPRPGCHSAGLPARRCGCANGLGPVRRFHTLLWGAHAPRVLLVAPRRNDAPALCNTPSGSPTPNPSARRRREHARARVLPERREARRSAAGPFQRSIRIFQRSWFASNQLRRLLNESVEGTGNGEAQRDDRHGDADHCGEFPRAFGAALPGIAWRAEAQF